jgi:hypothetical protein
MDPKEEAPAVAVAEALGIPIQLGAPRVSGENAAPLPKTANPVRSSRLSESWPGFFQSERVLRTTAVGSLLHFIGRVKSRDHGNLQSHYRPRGRRLRSDALFCGSAPATLAHEPRPLCSTSHPWPLAVDEASNTIDNTAGLEPASCFVSPSGEAVTSRDGCHREGGLRVALTVCGPLSLFDKREQSCWLGVLPVPSATDASQPQKALGK